MLKVSLGKLFLLYFRIPSTFVRLSFIFVFFFIFVLFNGNIKIYTKKYKMKYTHLHNIRTSEIHSYTKQYYIIHEPNSYYTWNNNQTNKNCLVYSFNNFISITMLLQMYLHIVQKIKLQIVNRMNKGTTK